MSTKHETNYEEHPDDKASREESEAEAAEHGDEVASARAVDLRALLTVYADEDAHRMLDSLREWFWGLALPHAVKKAKRAKPEPK